MGRRIEACLRHVCLVSLLFMVAWCTKVVLVPSWIGRSYNPVGAGSTEWYLGGVFAVKDSTGGSASAPLWAPPPPHADVIEAIPRLPWQPVTRHHHVEILLSTLVHDLAFAIITLGVILRGAKFVIDRRTPYGCVTVWWSVALSLAAAWLLELGLSLASRGNVPIEELTVGGFTLAAALGLVVGVIRHRRARAGRRDASPPAQAR